MALSSSVRRDFISGFQLCRVLPKIRTCFPKNLGYCARLPSRKAGLRATKVLFRQFRFMATANDLRRGMAINYNGDICVVLESQTPAPGNLRAFVQATIRSIRTGKSSDVRFSSTERIEPVPMITTRMEFSYKD